MRVTIELSEDVVQALQKNCSDISRAVLEALAIEGYRAGKLSEAQVARMLGYGSRMRVHALLKEAGVYLHYTEADLARDIETNRQLDHLRSR